MAVWIRFEFEGRHKALNLPYSGPFAVLTATDMVADKFPVNIEYRRAPACSRDSHWWVSKVVSIP